MGEVIAACDVDGSAALHHLATRTVVQLSTYCQEIPLSFNPEGTRVAVALRDHSILIAKIDGHEAARLVGHTDFIMRTAFSADGNHLVSCSEDRTVRMWDLRDATVEVLEVGAEATRCSQMADGRLVIGDRHGEVSVWPNPSQTALPKSLLGLRGWLEETGWTR
jgi:WD40 repeat protein